MSNRIPDMGGLTPLSDAELDAHERYAKSIVYSTNGMERVDRDIRLCAEVRMLRAIVGAQTLARLDAGEEASQ